jgi:hypothetical protein
MMGGSCVECSDGASFALAMVPMIGVCLLLFLFVLMFLLYTTRDKDQGDLVRSTSIAQMKATKRAYKCVGQLKILISFLQIFSSMPNVLDSVPWPIEFMQVALPLGIFNLDFLRVLSRTSCGLAVSFFDRFILHMILPLCFLLAILSACFAARLCRNKSKQHRTQINETTSKIVILIVLLLFPGLSTKVFQMWKCQKIDGIALPLLVQDFSITCHEGEHVAYTFLAVTFLFVYILGIPLTMFMLLWRNRVHLFDKESPKNRWVKTALGGLYVQYEPEYWWFELMILFNKTMMCGGLVVLAPGSPLQVLFAILIMQFHLLFLLKLAPYVKDSEDWSSFFATLGLCLMSLGAYSMMIKLEKNETKTIGLVTTVLPIMCIVVVVFIMVMYDFGLKERCCGGGRKKETSVTQVQPVHREGKENEEVKQWQ